MIFAKFRIAAAALFAVSIATFHLPASAQDSVTAPAQTGQDAPMDAHAELYAAIQSGIDQGIVMENALKAIEREYAQVPDFIQLEAVSPGFVKDYVAVLRPILVKSMTRSNAEMRLNMIDLFRREFTPAEASEVAMHYRSGPMQRLLGNVSRSFSPDSTISGIESDAPITAEQVDRDVTRAAVRGAIALSAEDRAEIDKKLAESAALRKFEALTPKIVAIRTEQENQPMRPDEEAELTALAEAFFAERFGG